MVLSSQVQLDNLKHGPYIHLYAICLLLEHAMRYSLYRINHYVYQSKMASTIQTYIREMHDTGLTIYIHFLHSVKYLGGNRVQVLSAFPPSPYCTFSSRKKWKQRKNGEYSPVHVEMSFKFYTFISIIYLCI